MADARSGSHHSLLDLALLQTSRGATAQGCGTRTGLTTTKVPSSAEVGDPDPIRQRSSNPAQMRSSQAETCFRRTVGDGLKMSVAGRCCRKSRKLSGSENLAKISFSLSPPQQAFVGHVRRSEIALASFDVVPHVATRGTHQRR